MSYKQRCSGEYRVLYAIYTFWIKKKKLRNILCFSNKALAYTQLRIHSDFFTTTAFLISSLLYVLNFE